MTSADRNRLLCVLLSIGISILWGISIARGGNAWLDFRAIYAGSRCLIHQHNPYNVGDLTREYLSEDGQRPPDDPKYLQAISLYVNLPTSFVVVAPFAAFSWGPAHILWMVVTGSAFGLALLLMWKLGATHAPRVSTFLACILALDCEFIFSAGNTAGIVVGLCGIAVWCLLEGRLIWLGVACLGLGLAIKPHDAGIIWLYFLLAGGVYRKRALQSLLITAAIGMAAVLWVSSVAPHWAHNWNANLATISAPGGINDPGPNSLTGRSIFPVVDLQAAISVFRDDPRFYNIASYLICGALLLLWLIWTLRTRFQVRTAWLALAAATAFEILITYHRPWDAELTMLAIPPCCMLWAKRDWQGKIGFATTAAAILFAGVIPSEVFKMLADSAGTVTAGFGGQFLTLVLRRPEPMALLAMGVFYLWVYLTPKVPSENTAASEVVTLGSTGNDQR